MEPTLAPQPANPPPHHTSAQLIYGIAIVILAVVLCGLICVVANIQIPFFSKFYDPVPIPPAPVAMQEPPMRHAMAANAGMAMEAASTSSSTTK